MNLVTITPLLLSAGFGSAMVGIGVSASNPSYEDSKSATFKSNATRTTVISIICFGFYQILDLVMGIMDLGTLSSFIASSDLLYLMVIFVPLPVIGILIVLFGSRILLQRE